MSRKNIASNAVVLFLIGTAIVLGVKIYQQQQSPVVTNDNSIQPNTTSEVAQKTVLDTPTQTSTEEEKRQYEELVRSQAKDAEILSILQCIAEPTVLKVKANTDLKIKNNSDIEHTITFGTTENYVIAANQTTSIKPTFAFGPGVYAYGCDRSPKPIGILLVE